VAQNHPDGRVLPVAGAWGSNVCDTGFFSHGTAAFHGLPVQGSVVSSADVDKTSPCHDAIDPVDGSMIRVAEGGAVGQLLNDPVLLSTVATIKLERFSATLVNDIMGLDQPLIAIAIRDVGIDALQYHYKGRFLARAALELEAEYYNEQMAVWEPLIETWRVRAHAMSPKPLRPNATVGFQSLALARQAMLRHPLAVPILDRRRSTKHGLDDGTAQVPSVVQTAEQLINRVMDTIGDASDAYNGMHSLPLALGWILFSLEDAIEGTAVRYVQNDSQRLLSAADSGQTSRSNRLSAHLCRRLVTGGNLALPRGRWPTASHTRVSPGSGNANQFPPRSRSGYAHRPRLQAENGDERSLHSMPSELEQKAELAGRATIAAAALSGNAEQARTSSML